MVAAYLDRIHPGESVLIRQRFALLNSLGEAISRFPSIREVYLKRGELPNKESLFEFLAGFSPSARFLRIPSRIISIRNYYAAKCQAFSLISNLVGDTERFKLPVRRAIISIICAFLTEEVYFSCLGDKDFPQGIKHRLAEELISLWDGDEELQTLHHVSALESLWAARDESPPSFGTLDGSSELIRVTLELGKDWGEFISTQVEKNETRWALEEFLFGLSYEEICDIRSRLTRLGINAVNRDEIRSFLGSQPKYAIIKDATPLAIYDFFIDRRDAAAFRKGNTMSGPWQTLEEMYLRFRLTQDLGDPSAS